GGLLLTGGSAADCTRATKKHFKRPVSSNRKQYKDAPIGIQAWTRKFFMATPRIRVLGSAGLSLVCILGFMTSHLRAQGPARNGRATKFAATGGPPPTNTPATNATATDAPAVVRLTFAEAKARALSTSKLLQMASLNAESKAYAIRAMQAMYFPQVSGTAIYLHFQ